MAHQIGLKSNATMLYGHVENDEDRVDHLLKLRALQDETGGFQTFIPLAFHPDNTPLQHLPKTTGMLDIKQIAVGRLVLDNFPHIKSYWQMMTAEDRADLAALRRRRHGRHGDRRKDLSRCRRDHSPGHAPGGTGAPDPRGRARADRARHAVSSRDADGDFRHRRRLALGNLLNHQAESSVRRLLRVKFVQFFWRCLQQISALRLSATMPALHRGLDVRGKQRRVVDGIDFPEAFASANFCGSAPPRLK